MRKIIKQIKKVSKKSVKKKQTFNLKFIILCFSNRIKRLYKKTKNRNFKCYRILRMYLLNILKIEDVKNLTQTTFISIPQEIIDTKRLRTKQDKHILISDLFPFLEFERFKIYGFSLLLNTTKQDWILSKLFSVKQEKLFALAFTIAKYIYTVEKYGIYGNKSNKYLYFYHQQFNSWIFLYNFYYMYTIYLKKIYLYHVHREEHKFVSIEDKITNYWYNEFTLKKKCHYYKCIIKNTNLLHLDYEKKKFLNKYKKLIYFFATIL